MFQTTTLADRPKAGAYAQRLGDQAWPTFLHHGDIRSWSALFDAFARYQILLIDSGGDLLGIGHTVPITWNGEKADLPANVEAIIRRGIQAKEERKDPTALSALAIIVSPKHQRNGHSTRILQAMRELAAREGMASLIAPVRPTLKQAYPLTPFARYIDWKREDGLPFDPWLRVHARLGAEMLKIIPEGVLVEGTIPEWESWTSMRFPDSGEYVVPGALQPVEIDARRNLGRYADPNIWMLHPLGGNSGVGPPARR